MKRLYAKYKEASGTTLSQDEFENLVIFFPTLLIVASDGEIDDEEKLYLEYLARFMSKSTYQTQNKTQKRDRKTSQQRYLDALEFLTKSENGNTNDLSNLAKWEPLFVDVLKQHIKNDPNGKAQIEEIMRLFADASDGISDDEENKIQEILSKI